MDDAKGHDGSPAGLRGKQTPKDKSPKNLHGLKKNVAVKGGESQKVGY